MNEEQENLNRKRSTCGDCESLDAVAERLSVVLRVFFFARCCVETKRRLIVLWNYDSALGTCPSKRMVLITVYTVQTTDQSGGQNPTPNSKFNTNQIKPMTSNPSDIARQKFLK